MRRSLRGHAPLVLAGTVTLCAASFTAAQTSDTWDGGGGDDKFTTGANWVDNSAPNSGSTSDLTFTGANRLNPNNDYGGFAPFRNILFDGAAGSFNLTGNAIDLWGKIENNGANTQTVSLSALALKSSTDNELNPVAGDLVVNSANIFTNGFTLNVWGNNGKTLTFGTGSVISQGGALSINQNSNVVFQSTHTYTGNTFINAGSLQFAQGGSTAGSFVRLGSDASTTPAAVSIIDPDGGTTVVAPINVRGPSGGGGLRTISATNVSGTNTFSGDVYLDNNVTTSVPAGGTLAFTGSVFELKGHSLVVGGAGNTSIAKPLTTNEGGQNGSLVKEGSGTLTLSHANNTYLGTTVVRGGTLAVTGTIVAGGGPVLVSSDAPDAGTLAGTGTVNRTVTLASGGSVSPGVDNIGKLTTGAETWNGGAAYVWEIGPLTVAGNGETVDPGTPGTNWDLIDLGSAGLTINATASNRFSIKVVRSGSVSIDETNGQVWFTIARSTSGTASGFDATKFVLPDVVGGAPDWEVRTVSLGGGGGGFVMQVSPTPELGSATLFGTGAAALLLSRWRLRAWPGRQRNTPAAS